MTGTCEAMFEFISIGKILKPFRYSGEFIAIVNPGVFEDLKDCSALFLKIDGLEVPFFIENIELDPEGSYIKLEEFNAPEDVKPFNGQKLYLRTIDVKYPSLLTSKPDNFALDGFTLQDVNTGKSYLIESTAEYPQQLMAIVHVNNQEVLIPLVDEWIQNIDAAKELIQMALPEGLIES